MKENAEVNLEMDSKSNLDGTAEQAFGEKDSLPKRNKKHLNMTEGPFLKKIVIFVIPLILTGLLQSFYNAADLAVVGYFRGEIALAAVGSTGSLTNLIVGLFMGLSVGAGVVVAHSMGALKYRRVNKTVHSAVLLAGILGVFVAVVGIVFAPQLLRMMDTPDSVIEYSVLYIRIIFCGVPASMIYNYCASMVRSTGDTKHPLIFLAVSGLLNVVLNLVMVVGFGFGVEGVAIATIASQYLSAVMILVFMARSDGCLQFCIKRLRFHRPLIKKMLYIGIPSGIQGSLFSLSNVMIQSAINGFGDTIMAGNTAASNLEGFVYIAMNAVYQASLTFVGQNVGAKTYRNIKKITILCLCSVVVLGLTTGGVILFFREFFVGLYAPGNAVVTEVAVTRLFSILPVYFLCGMMEVLAGAIRGMGKSVTTMVISLLGACAFRIVWVKTIFLVAPKEISWIYLSYPISWLLVIVFDVLFLVYYYRKLVRQKES